MNPCHLEEGVTINGSPGPVDDALMMGYSISFLQEGVHSNKQESEILSTDEILVTKYTEILFQGEKGIEFQSKTKNLLVRGWVFIFLSLLFDIGVD